MAQPADQTEEKTLEGTLEFEANNSNNNSISSRGRLIYFQWHLLRSLG